MAVVIPLNNFPGPADDTVTAQTYYRIQNTGVTQSDRYYARLINALLELQALTQELKPETLVLVSNCAGEHELQQAMLNGSATIVNTD